MSGRKRTNHTIIAKNVKWYENIRRSSKMHSGNILKETTKRLFVIKRGNRIKMAERMAACLAAGIFFILSANVVSAAVSGKLNILPSWFKNDASNSEFVSKVEEEGDNEEVHPGRYVPVQDEAGKKYYIKWNYAHGTEGTMEGVYLVDEEEGTGILENSPEALAREIVFNDGNYTYSLVGNLSFLSFDISIILLRFTEFLEQLLRNGKSEDDSKHDGTGKLKGLDGLGSGVSTSGVKQKICRIIDAGSGNQREDSCYQIDGGRNPPDNRKGSGKNS